MILDEIVKKKREKIPLTVRGRRPSHLPLISLKKNLKREKRISFIAEIKLASPSEGDLIKGKEPLEILKEYEENGAEAISVITEEDFFKGNLELLYSVKRNTSLPVLRKDFLLHPSEILQAWINGADAVLLIARILSLELLKSLLEVTKEKGMEALVEVHNEREIEMAVEAGSEIIGVNNRDLDTLNVDINVSLRLINLIPEKCLKITESGIYSFKQVKLLQEAGFDAILVGTSLLKSKQPGKKLRELIQ